MARRPIMKADEHPRPQVMVPMSMFGALFFANNNERAGRWIHLWTFAVWKKDPKYYELDATETEMALYDGWLVKDRRGHLRLTGPARDKRWLLDSKKTWWTYAIEAVDQHTVKVGHSIDVPRRLEELQVASPHQLRLLGSVKGDCEKALHRLLRSEWRGGEWFTLSERTVEVLTGAGLCEGT